MYSTLNSWGGTSDALRMINANESTIQFLEFDPQFGWKWHYIGVWEGVVGLYCDAILNNNGVLLLQLCCNKPLCIAKLIFQRRDLNMHTWCRDSLGRKVTDCFLHHISWLTPLRLEVHVKSGEILSTDHHLAVCNLRPEKLIGPTQTRGTSTSCGIKWEAIMEINIL